jgi:chorismate mutase-like protein
MLGFGKIGALIHGKPGYAPARQHPQSPAVSASFLKNRSKKRLLVRARAVPAPKAQAHKSFCALFSKKALLPSLAWRSPRPSVSVRAMNDHAPLTLAALRARIDAIDTQIHDLLMQRAAVVDSVGRDGGKTGAKIRPGREATILRRLLARHTGPLPPQAITRFWREMFAAALIIEGGQTIAVCDGDNGSDRVALAREHFGPLTPLRRHHNPAQTLADLARGTAQVAVLPPPGDDDESAAWWTQLAASGPHRFSVIAKLPFWTRRAEGSPVGEAFVVAAMLPDPSGADRGLISLDLSADTSRAKVTSLLAAAGFAPGPIWVKRAGEAGIRALVEVEGLVEDDDSRLAAIAGLNAPATVLGGYAVPLEAP